MIEVLKAGPLATVQDLGRYGYRRYGAPVSGAMDLYSSRVGNILVGNPQDAAVVEITYGLIRIRTDEEACVAVTGGDLSPSVNGAAVPMWTPVVLGKGDELAFSSPRTGLRAYLAVQGGIDLAPILGSRSTTVKARFGGTGGALTPGDILPVGPKRQQRVQNVSLPPGFIPDHRPPWRLRAIPGPQDDHFSPATLHDFFASTYTVSPQSDRQGYRLQGPEIPHQGDYNIVTEPVWPGAVQVAGDKLPIILLVDAQTTGGYPKIASVISRDLCLLGQAAPGDAVVFEAVGIGQAHDLLRQWESSIRDIAALYGQ